jgi:hypothetical protein
MLNGLTIMGITLNAQAFDETNAVLNWFGKRVFGGAADSDYVT